MTHRTPVVVALALALLASLAGHGCDSRSAAARSDRPAPGYHGPCPSPEAQGLLLELRGATLALAGGGEVVIGDFAVVPNPVTGKGPVVGLSAARSLFIRAADPGVQCASAAVGSNWQLPARGRSPRIPRAVETS